MRNLGSLEFLSEGLGNFFIVHFQKGHSILLIFRSFYSKWFFFVQVVFIKILGFSIEAGLKQRVF